MVVKAAIPLFSSRSPGFTLLELIAVIAIVGILSVVAFASFNRRVFDTAAFARQLESAIAYAQKAAVAKRRTVTVTVGATSASFAICNENPCVTSAALSLPDTTSATLSAPSGVTLSPATFSFLPSGEPSGAVNITVTGDGSRTVVVEASSGYVH